MAGKKTHDVPFPVRGVPGGWKDVFDEDDGEVIHHHAEMFERDQALLRELAAKQRGKGLPPGAPLKSDSLPGRIDP